MVRGWGGRFPGRFRILGDSGKFRNSKKSVGNCFLEGLVNCFLEGLGNCFLKGLVNCFLGGSGKFPERCRKLVFTVFLYGFEFPGGFRKLFPGVVRECFLEGLVNRVRECFLECSVESVKFPGGFRKTCNFSCRV